MISDPDRTGRFDQSDREPIAYPVRVGAQKSKVVDPVRTGQTRSKPTESGPGKPASAFNKKKLGKNRKRGKKRKRGEKIGCLDGGGGSRPWRGREDDGRCRLASSSQQLQQRTAAAVCTVAGNSAQQLLYALLLQLMETLDSRTTPNESQSVSGSGVGQPSQTNPRQKKDVAWKYVTETTSSEGRKILTCDFCRTSFRGGGINRMKQHLAGEKGNVASCKKVPPEISAHDEFSYDDYTAHAQKESHKQHLESSKKKAKTLDSFFKIGTRDPSQPTIKASLQSKEKWYDTDMAIALWFYDSCIPLNACNSPFFQIAMSKVASMGHGYIGPSYRALRVSLLRDAKKQVVLIFDSFRSKWIETGCTIMGDGWKDSRQKPLVNFLVYCPSGISFIKSVDVSAIESTTEMLCNLFAEIVEMVGVKNIVHLVTNNAANYKAAGRLLSEKYPTICWSPCAAHCVNLILKDIGELSHVKDCAILASKVTCYIYNNKRPLNWLRQREGWTEIIRPGDTRFATTFIALKSLSDHKDDLQAIVTCQDFKKFLKKDMAKQVKQVILDERFWNSCNIIVRVGTPLVRLLRICDSDEMPSLGYVYEGMFRARKAIKDLFCNKKRLYQQYVDIINARWDKMLRKSLHAAAYYLNPTFQYDKEFFCEKTEKLAIQILSQTTSSSGCEWNWSVFERIHTKKRNRLEHQRLNDLVYVHYNLRLQNRVKYSKRPYDPVDYECIDKSEFWIVEKIPEGELDYDEMEELLEEEMPRYDEGLNFDPETETNDAEPIAEADLEQFGRQYRSTCCSDNENEDDWD
ncbi:UNVERIFIED_CONTAM: hypothetical protein Sradi_2069400 [Sesamum radiatum]|uniref:BED-type domain-containing protein n=1 Tax=Sesamum radiatum TaxID=300843 RepID=A0AAW2THR6_SESRA